MAVDVIWRKDNHFGGWLSKEEVCVCIIKPICVQKQLIFKSKQFSQYWFFNVALNFRWFKRLGKSCLSKGYSNKLQYSGRSSKWCSNKLFKRKELIIKFDYLKYLKNIALFSLTGTASFQKKFQINLFLIFENDKHTTLLTRGLI